MDANTVRAADGIIEPKSLQTLALDAVYPLLRKAWYMAEAENEDKSDNFRHCVRTLLGVENDFAFSTVVSNQFVDRFATLQWLDSAYLASFCNSKIGCITRVDLSAFMSMTEELFTLILQQPLLELTMPVCATDDIYSDVVKWKWLKHLANSPASATLKSLTISSTDEYEDQMEGFKSFEWLNGLTSLARLDLHGMFLPYAGNFLGPIVEHLPNLAVLDLSRTLMVDLQARQSNLKALSLNSIPLHLNHIFFKHVLEIRTLVSLDLSIFEHTQLMSPNVQNMAQQLSEMPCLKYLDIAGHQISTADLVHFDPPHHRMSFMGLLATPACTRGYFNCDMVRQMCIDFQF